MAGFGITKAPSWGKAILNKFKKKSKSDFTKDKSGTITGVKPMSGKIPWYVGAGKKDPKKRAKIVKTHFSLKRSEKINKAVKDIKEGKEKLKHMEATGQAKELKDYKGKGTGSWHRKGFGLT